MCLCRFILNLRQTYLEANDSYDVGGFNTSFQVSSCANAGHASRLVGNLGAPLRFRSVADDDFIADDDGEIKEEIHVLEDPLAEGLGPIES